MSQFCHYIRYRLTRHLNEAQQGYFEHLSDAWSFAARSGVTSLSFFFHGLFPFALEHSGSSQLSRLHSDVCSKLTKFKKRENVSMPEIDENA